MAVKDDTAGILEWRVEQSDDWTTTATFTTSAGAAIDLSSYTWLCQVRDTRGGTVLATSAAPTSNITIGTGSAASGIITVTIADTVTSGISAGYHWWLLKGTVSGLTRTYLKGPLFVVDEDG